MGYLGSIFEATLLILNALAILNERRFLAKCNIYLMHNNYKQSYSINYRWIR